MKTLLLIAMTALSLRSANALENPGVHQRLFNVFTVIYQTQVDADFCKSAGEECIVRVKEAVCLRNSHCEVVYENEQGEDTKVWVAKTHGYYLSLYIIARKAFAIQLGDWSKFGPRFRPHFRLNALLTCRGDNSYQNAECF